jgi:hypothetical protein
VRGVPPGPLQRLLLLFLLPPSWLLPPLLPDPKLLEMSESPSEPLLESPLGAAEVHGTVRVMVRVGVLQAAPQGASWWRGTLPPVLILAVRLKTIYES